CYAHYETLYGYTVTTFTQTNTNTEAAFLRTSRIPSPTFAISRQACEGFAATTQVFRKESVCGFYLRHVTRLTV
ncbi:unnamed protein product, partial [Leptidea sinapis]